MTCEQFRAVNFDWPTFKALDPETRLQCATHADKCSACDAWVTEQAKSQKWTQADIHDATELCLSDHGFSKISS
jgi:hypothetical protein